MQSYLIWCYIMWHDRSILLYSILFFSFLLYSFLFYSMPFVIFYSILFFSLLFYSILFFSVLFYSTLFSIPFYSIMYCYFLFYSVLFYTIIFYTTFYSILFWQLTSVVIVNTRSHSKQKKTNYVLGPRSCNLLYRTSRDSHDPIGTGHIISISATRHYKLGKCPRFHSAYQQIVW